MKVPKPHILLVEDDVFLATSLRRTLRDEYVITTVSSCSGGERVITESKQPIAAVLLDRVLPDGDGIDLIPFCQKFCPGAQLCVLSSLDSNAERIRGLTRGADLYLPKPFSNEVLRHQLHALLKRQRVVGNRGILWQHWTLLREEALVENIDTQKSIVCTPNETICLELMWRHPSGFVSHSDLEHFFASRDVENIAATAQITMRRLRQKLKSIDLTIQARRGSGYYLTLLEKK